MINENIGVSQGWQCPICGRVYSPMIPMCYYCGGEQKTITYTTSTENVENVEKAKMKSFAKQIGEYHDKL